MYAYLKRIVYVQKDCQFFVVIYSILWDFNEDFRELLFSEPIQGQKYVSFLYLYSPVVRKSSSNHDRLDRCKSAICLAITACSTATVPCSVTAAASIICSMIVYSEIMRNEIVPPARYDIWV